MSKLADEKEKEFEGNISVWCEKKGGLMEWEKKDILGNSWVCVCVRVCVWKRLNVSTSQAETITSVGCLFLARWANLIEAKH